MSDAHDDDAGTGAAAGMTFRAPREPFVPPGGIELLERDMTAIFSADCTLRAAQDRLGAVGQWLPVDGDPDATLGALVDRNSTGPLRLGFGGWRDLLLGAQFTNGRGELISAGGRTIKNVAGYDLTKFMVGSFGIFGRVVTITTRTVRQPDAALLVRFAPEPARLAALLPTHLRPQWSLLTPGELLCGYLGDATTVEWYEANVRTADPRDVTRRSFQDDADHRASVWRITEGALAFRASVPPAKLATFADALGGDDARWAADPAFGVVFGAVADEAHVGRVRASAESLGGSARFGADVDTLDVSTNPAERQIIERLKQAFDPDNRLHPLPWQRR